MLLISNGFLVILVALCMIAMFALLYMADVIRKQITKEKEKEFNYANIVRDTHEVNHDIMAQASEAFRKWAEDNDLPPNIAETNTHFGEYIDFTGVVDWMNDRFEEVEFAHRYVENSTTTQHLIKVSETSTTGEKKTINVVFFIEEVETDLLEEEDLARLREEGKIYEEDGRDYVYLAKKVGFLVPPDYEVKARDLNNAMERYKVSLNFKSRRSSGNLGDTYIITRDMMGLNLKRVATSGKVANAKYLPVKATVNGEECPEVPLQEAISILQDPIFKYGENVLFGGITGSGKTVSMNYVIQLLTQAKECVILRFNVNRVKDLTSQEFTEFLNSSRFKLIVGDKRVVIAIDDAGDVLRKPASNSIKPLMEGVDKETYNLQFLIATTEFKSIDPEVIRPGRTNIILETTALPEEKVRILAGDIEKALPEEKFYDHTKLQRILDDEKSSPRGTAWLSQTYAPITPATSGKRSYLSQFEAAAKGEIETEAKPEEVQPKLKKTNKKKLFNFKK